MEAFEDAWRECKTAQERCSKIEGLVLKNAVVEAVYARSTLSSTCYNKT